MAKLTDIQKELKAPKNQYNSFGRYNYRNCEDILEAVKPLLGDCVLTLSDEVVNVGTCNYVKATATFMSTDGVGEVSVSAYAREAVQQKGMNDAQITGSSSSYARKYALNGLFLIDDTKDDDFNNQPVKEKPIAKSDKPTLGLETFDKIAVVISEGVDRAKIEKRLANYKISKDQQTEINRLFEEFK